MASGVVAQAETGYSIVRRKCRHAIRLSATLEHFSQLYSEPIAAVSDVVPTLGRRVEGERSGDEGGDLIEGAWSRGSQEGVQFGERELDRVEVGTIGREKSELGAGRFDGGADLGLFVHGQVVEDDDVAWSQRGHQDLLDVRQKTRTVDGPVEHGRRAQPVRPQPDDDRVGLPVPAGRVVVEALATKTPAIPAEQVGRDAAFIEKDVLSHVAEWQPLSPVAPLSRDVGPSLLLGVDRFF